MSSIAPEVGPCTMWITGEDVDACCPQETSDTALLDIFAAEASSLLFELSGRQFSGQCSQTVRPCNDPCGCWGSSGWTPGGAWYWAPWQGGMGWINDCGNVCGCGYISRAKLSGYPVTEITEVKINGDVIDPGGYRLDGYRWLTRLWEPNVENPDNPTPRWWPSCQNMALNDDQPGTWSVTYSYGVDPPLAGVKAAEQLACQLALQCAGAECQLPDGASQITRLGVTINRGLLATWGFSNKQWGTGLAQVDAFLNGYNRSGLRRRPAVFSPDIQQYAKRLGS